MSAEHPLPANRISSHGKVRDASKFSFEFIKRACVDVESTNHSIWRVIEETIRRGTGLRLRGLRGGRIPAIAAYDPTIDNAIAWNRVLGWCSMWAKSTSGSCAKAQIHLRSAAHASHSVLVSMAWRG